MMVRLVASLIVIWVAASHPVSAGDMGIRGTVDVAPDLRALITHSDRLIIKMYHPKDGQELDVTYRILPQFSLPQAFVIHPSLDMNRRAKWPAYKVEIFTDRDRDVIARADGEVAAATDGLVPLGSSDIALVMNRRR